MKFRTLFAGLSSIVAAGLLLLSGCGGGADLSCGEGTTEQDGECVAETSDGVCGENTTDMNGTCVPDTDSICSSEAGAVQAENGSCVIADGACGEGTRLAADTGACIPSDQACGEGLALNSENQCEPTDEICDEGATFEDGLCVPDVSCQEGDVVLNGECVPEAEKLAEDPDVTESENNDPNTGGTANEIPVKEPGEESRTTFLGAIGPPEDLTGDGEPNQDVDTYSFSAEAGEWFEISVRSLGLPSPLVIINGPGQYQRVTPVGVRRDTVRQIAVPRDGEYTISVMPTLQIFAPTTAQPTGSEEDWKYVGVLEQLETPSAEEVELSSSSATGEVLNLEDNYFKVTEFSGDGVAEISIDTLGTNMTGPVVEIWKDESTFQGEFPLSEGIKHPILVPSSGEFYLLINASFVTGLETGFEVSGSEVSNVRDVGLVESGTETDPVDVSAGETLYYEFTVGTGEVVEVQQTNAENETVSQSMVATSGRTIPGSGDFGSFEDSETRAPTEVYYYASEEKSVFMKIQPQEMASLTDFQLQFDTQTPTDIGSAGPGDSVTHSSTSALEGGASAFHTFDASAAAEATITVTPPGEESLAVFLYDAEYQFLGAETPGLFGGGGEQVLGGVDLQAGTQLLHISAGETLSTYDVDVSLEAP